MCDCASNKTAPSGLNFSGLDLSGVNATNAKNIICEICKVLGCGTGNSSFAAMGAGAGVNPHDIACLVCNLLGCGSHGSGLNGGGSPLVAASASLPRVLSSVSLSHVQTRANFVGGGDSDLVQMHLLANGDHFVTDVQISDDQNTVTIPLHGTLLGIAYDLKLTVTVDIVGGTVKVTLDITNPIEFTHTWVFSFKGIRDPKDPKKLLAVVGGLEQITPLGESKPAMAMAAANVPIPCIVLCVGPELANVLGGCLAKLPDVGAFLGCVGSQLPGHLVQIALCVGGCFLKG